MPPTEIKRAGINKLISELDEHKACGPSGSRPIILERPDPPSDPPYRASAQSHSRKVKCKMIGNMPMLPHSTRKETGTTLPTAALFLFSLKCVSCKFMEHIVVSNFMRHLEANHILNPNQNGFRKGLSCETQLVELSHALLTNRHIYSWSPNIYHHP